MGAPDVLKGVIPRNGGHATSFGAILDSAFDRLSRLSVYLAGRAIHGFLAGNVKYVSLGVTIAADTTLISYVKAHTLNIMQG